MRVLTSLADNDYKELKKEDLEVLGSGGYLFPPFGQHITDYVEIHIHDKDRNFKEKVISEHTRFEDGNIMLNIGQDLRDNGYDRGTFVCIYYFVRPVAGADDIVLTKTVNGVSGLIHTGNPDLTGISSQGDFYLDENQQPFIGLAPPAEGEPKPLDVKEWKYKIDEISTSRTEVRIVPQIISNQKYKMDFRKLIENSTKYVPETAWDDYIDANPDLLAAWNIIQSLPNNSLSKWWRPRLEYQDGVTTKKDFGKLHYTMYGYSEDRDANPGDGGGQISWTGPDSARLEFNVRRDTEDEGFQSYMQGGTLVVKDAYVVDEEIRNDSFENANYSPEDPIPDTHIEISDSVEDPRTKTYTMMLRNREGTSINDDVDAEFNTNSQQIQYFWDFGCGHTEGPTIEHQVSHTYDVDGSYIPSCTILTPNFDSNVTDVKTISGRNQSPVLVETPIEFQIETGEVESTEVPIPMTSAYDGKIIKWNGNGSPAPFFSTGQSRATTSTRWWVQNGHTRAIQGGDNGTIIPLRQLTNITSDDDISVPLTHINQLRLGPNLDYTNMGNPDENELTREITIDWIDPGNPNPFITNREEREEAALPPPTHSVVITPVFLTFEGNQQDLSVPDEFSIASINSNVNPESTLNLTGPDGILLNFVEGQEVTLTFSPNGPFSSPFNSATIGGGGTVNNDINTRTVSFTADSDKTIEVIYGIEMGG